MSYSSQSRGLLPSSRRKVGLHPSYSPKTVPAILAERVRLELTRRKSGYSRISNPLPYQLGLPLHMERVKRFELSLPVWKTGVLTVKHYTRILATRLGFEPRDGFPPPVFKTGAISHSATLPYSLLLNNNRTFQPCKFNLHYTQHC